MCWRGLREDETEKGNQDIELKWNKPSEEAIGQIRKNHYPAVLEGYGGEIVMAGINYDTNTKEHSCVIERLHQEAE